jgi:hypothetical protein
LRDIKKFTQMYDLGGKIGALQAKGVLSTHGIAVEQEDAVR